jgi:hypothetical protein
VARARDVDEVASRREAWRALFTKPGRYSVMRDGRAVATVVVPDGTLATSVELEPDE